MLKGKITTFTGAGPVCAVAAAPAERTNNKKVIIKSLDGLVVGIFVFLMGLASYLVVEKNLTDNASD
jgi:hypothetical protein